MPTSIPVAPSSLDPRVTGLMRLIVQELEQVPAGGPPRTDQIALALARRIVGTAGRKTETAEGTPPAPIAKAIAHIRENLPEPLPLESIARVAGLSTFYFSRLFKEWTGLAPHQFVIQARIDRAKELLLRSPMTVAEVTQACGFGTQSQLGQLFKRCVGYTPVQFRQLHSSMVPLACAGD